MTDPRQAAIYWYAKRTKDFDPTKADEVPDVPPALLAAGIGWGAVRDLLQRALRAEYHVLDRGAGR